VATSCWSHRLRDGRRGDQLAEAQRFRAQIGPDEIFAFVRRAAFVEEEVDHFERGVETLREFFSARHVERQMLVTNLTLGAYEALRDGFIGGQQGAGDFTHVEACRDLQAERDTCFAGIAGWQHMKTRRSSSSRSWSRNLDRRR
jgi:hypothetical protein